MSIIDKKKKVFGNIAAAKTLTEGYPKLKTSSSFPSINNNGNSVSFLSDLTKSLTGYESLVNTLVDTLTHSLGDINSSIKNAVKTELKSIVSCGVDPSIPSFLASGGSGIVIEASKLDFFDILKIDPNSIGGQLSYGDANDFKRFLHTSTQSSGTKLSWPSFSGVDMLDFEFNAQGIKGIIPNNTFKINMNPNFNIKTLTDFNNSFMDSIQLFNTQDVINNVIDGIFGTLSSFLNKPIKLLEIESKVDNVIDCIINTDYNDIIDDSYFTFSNAEVFEQQKKANIRKKGIAKLECCNKVDVSIPAGYLTKLNSDLTGATTTAAKKVAIVNNLNLMANQTTVNSENVEDNITLKLDFIQQLINELTKTIVKSLLDPKIVTIFLINYKIINGQNATYDDAIDFIKKNKNLVKDLTKKISEMIIAILLAVALKKIGELIGKQITEIEIEKAKNKLAQLLSLVGVQPDVLRKIQGLTI